MKKISYDEFQKLIYPTYTGFLFNESGVNRYEARDVEDIRRDTKEFENSTEIELYELDELPISRNIIRHNIISAIFDEVGETDFAYKNIVNRFRDKDFYIARTFNDSVRVDMLVWKL